LTFDAWVLGKTVAVVGNASSQSQKKQGTEIDSHDVVIRMNRAAGLFDGADVAESHGVKTDVWCVWDANDRVLRPHLERFPGQVWHISNENQKTSLADWCMPPERFQAVKSILGVWLPSSGFLLLNLLADCGPRSVDVYGFDFKRSASHGYDKVLTYPHRFDIEEDHCQQHIFSRSDFNLQ
jgi:hypothetical protein